MTERRSGIKFITDALGPDSRLAVVQFSTEQTYVMECAGDFVRFYQNDAVVAEGRLDKPLAT